MFELDPMLPGQVIRLNVFEPRSPNPQSESLDPRRALSVHNLVHGLTTTGRRLHSAPHGPSTHNAVNLIPLVDCAPPECDNAADDACTVDMWL